MIPESQQGKRKFTEQPCNVRALEYKIDFSNTTGRKFDFAK
jgi:hypothetical protein